MFGHCGRDSNIRVTANFRREMRCRREPWSRNKGCISRLMNSLTPRGILSRAGPSGALAASWPSAAIWRSTSCRKNGLPAVMSRSRWTNELAARTPRSMFKDVHETWVDYLYWESPLEDD